MPGLKSVVLVLAVAAALAGAGSAAAGCRVARDHGCFRPGASCPADGRRGVCETLRHPSSRGVLATCICATPIGHGGGPSHRK
jgi:hypothetical protein